MKAPNLFSLLRRLVHGGRSDADAALDEASRLRAKEQADHKARLRANAASVTVPEHPAVTLLREIERGHPWSKSCPECAAVTPSDPLEDVPHTSDCRLAAILAGSKPGAHTLSDLLADEREACAQVAIAEAQAAQGADGVDTAQRILLGIRARGQR